MFGVFKQGAHMALIHLVRCMGRVPTLPRAYLGSIGTLSLSYHDEQL
jgi:hypothetical protein